jgi:transposase
MIAVVRERCAGIDVHRDMVMTCVMWGAANEEARYEIRKFGTTVGELLELKKWLQEQDIREVVLESTGVYWEPVFNVLGEEWEERQKLERIAAEGQLSEAEQQRQQELAVSEIRVTLANPQEVKNRRGHKTDKKDAWWLAHLFRHGMVRASYLPERAVRELRMLTRQRREKIRDVARQKNRLQKVLEQGNVKLRGVMSDLFGASGEAMLEAMILEQQTDPAQLAELAKSSLRNKKPELIAALTGHRLPEAHRLLLRQGMEHLSLLVEQIEQLDREIDRKISAEGWQPAYQNLQTIPGIKETAAAEILAEAGPRAAAFPDAAHLSSWGGVCPGNDESAGKRRSARTGKGNPYFRAALNQSAWASSRKVGSEFQARYHRSAPKLKHKGAVVAVAHALVYAIYGVLHYGRPYQPPQVEGMDQQKTQSLIRHHSKRLRKLKAWLPKAPVLRDCTKVLGRLETVGDR